MPYPYTLMPDGHTMEPGLEPPKPPATTQEESTLENDSPPASTSSTTPEPDPITGPLPFGAEPSPFATPEYTQYGQPPSTEAEAERRKQRIEKARERLQKAKQSATNVQSSLDVSQPEVIPDIGETELFQVCENLCDQHPELARAGLKIIKGFDPVEDDEEDVKMQLIKQLRLMGLNDAFGHGDWYTTRLGPTVSHVAAKITDDFFDQVKTFDAAVLAAAAIDEEPMPDEQRVKVEASDREPQPLNYHALEHLRKYVDGWDETWATEKDVSNVIIKKLEDTYGIQVKEDFAELPIEDQLQEFLEFIYYHRESYYSRTWQYESPYREVILTVDYNDFLPLLGLLKPAPLNSPDALAEAFDFISEAHAVDYLRHHLRLVYTEMGYDLPENWSEFQDRVQLGNMLYTVLEEIKIKREFDADYDLEFSLDFKFHDAYGLHGSDVNRDFARLADTYQLPDYSLFVFIFTMLWEPADYALTIAEMGDDISRGDRLSAFIRGAIGLVPGAVGRLTKKFRSADEITDSFRWFDATDQRALTVSGPKLPDDILNRGYPEQVVREMASGEATRPALYRDRRRTIPEDHLEKSNDIGIKLQNDVTEFMFKEGYLVESLGPQKGAHRMQVYEDAGYKPHGEPDLVIWQALPDGTYEPRYYDIYSPQTNRVKTMEREIRRKARQQGGHIVVNLERASDEVDLEDLQHTLRRSQDKHLREAVILKLVSESADGKKVYEIVHIWTFNPAG